MTTTDHLVDALTLIGVLAHAIASWLRSR